MRYPQRRFAISALAIGLLSISPSACRDVAQESASEPAPLSAELAQYLTDSARIVAGLDTSNANGILTSVWYGRILPDRHGVILADRADPFLRVFHRTGRLITTALPKGEGPREAGRVSGLAVSVGREVLVLTGLDRTRLMEYVFEGDSLRFLRAQPSPSDIPMFTVASRCGHGWAAYTTRQLRSRASIPVVSVSNRDSSGGLVWRNAASWTSRIRDLNWGSPQAMTSDERYVYVWHNYSLGRPILAIPCEQGSDSARILRYTDEISSNLAMQPMDESGGAAMVITDPDTMYTGFSVLQGILFESETITDYDED